MQGEQVAEAGGLTTRLTGLEVSRAPWSCLVAPGAISPPGWHPTGCGEGRHQTQARVRPETLGPEADQSSDKDAPTVLLASRVALAGPLCLPPVG